MRTALLLATCCTLVWTACSSDPKSNSNTTGANTVNGGATNASVTTGSDMSTGGTTGSTAGPATGAGATGGTTGGATTDAGTTSGGTTDAGTSTQGTTDAGATTTAGTTSTGAGGATSTTGTSTTGTTPTTSLNCDPPEGTLPGLDLELVADGFDDPLYVAQPPGDSERLFVVEQPGAIHIVQDGTTLEPPFLEIGDQVSTSMNERGMFGIAFHPNFASNGIFYVHYSATNGTHGLSDGDTVLSEFVVSSGDPNVADMGSERVVFTLDQPEWNHNGGMIEFGPDNFLYLGLGDGGGSGDPDGNGQDTDTLLGTILRLDVDTRDAGEYGIPAGNITDGAPEIWDWGLRNPWRFSFDGCTGDLYIADVGQNDREEVNVEPAGMGNRNYGWDTAEGLSCYPSNVASCERGGFAEPVLDYGRNDGISVTGGYVYRGSDIPALRGTYLYGDYSSRTIWSFQYSGGMAQNQQEVNFTGRDLASEFTEGAGLTSFGQDNAGEIYITLRNGEVLKIVADE